MHGVMEIRVAIKANLKFSTAPAVSRTAHSLRATQTGENPSSFTVTSDQTPWSQP